MKLLGVHVIGESASELVHVGLTALLTGAGADLFIHTCYNYPTLTEIYKYATYDALGARARKD
jgi:NAD(P) transhydrogenase